MQIKILIFLMTTTVLLTMFNNIRNTTKLCMMFPIVQNQLKKIRKIQKESTLLGQIIPQMAVTVLMIKVNIYQVVFALLPMNKLTSKMKSQLLFFQTLIISSTFVKMMKSFLMRTMILLKLSIVFNHFFYLCLSLY